MQGTWIWPLYREDFPCHEATKPNHHNSWVRAIEPMSHNYWSPRTLEPVLCKRSHRNEKPSVQFSPSVVSDSLWPHGLQHARPPCPSPTPGVYSNSCPSNQWCHPNISSSVLSPSPPAFNLSQHQGLFRWVSSSHQVAKVLQFQFQHQSFQWTFRTDFL